VLVLTSATLATVAQLFEFKSTGFALPPFPGYSQDQWGIKAHNRPWIVANGDWAVGQRVIEVGGAYSRLPEWLGHTFGVEPWIADDFGAQAGEHMWARWGDPQLLPTQHPSVRYAFERMGRYSPSFPDGHFDRIFTVSTLEHIPFSGRLDVLRDMNRCTAPGGMQLHTIDIPVPPLSRAIAAAAAERVGLSRLVGERSRRSIPSWIQLFKRSGVRIDTRVASTTGLLDRRVLVESSDVVFRFYPPNDSPKPYNPAASLLIIIEDMGGPP
jgi:hypothetical protein